MSNLPQITPTTPLGSVLNKIIENANSNTLVKNNDIELVKSSGGTSVRVSPYIKNLPNLYPNYRGEWNTGSAYSMNDVVRVTQQTGSATSGVWICVADIPDKAISDVLKTQGWVEGSVFVRWTEVNYNPVYPEPPVTLQDITSTMNPLQKAQIRYWELLSLLPIETKMCINGVESVAYVDAFISGSTA